MESLKRGVSKARRLWREGHMGRALSQVEGLLEEWPHNSHLLVLRAELTQLQDDVDGVPSLWDAKADLAQAVGLDEDSPSALIELGYFCFVHDDDAKTASKHFDKAVRLCVDYLTQALVGQAEAASELDQEAKVLSSLMTACGLAAHYRGAVRENVLERIKNLMEENLGAESVAGNGSKR